MSPRRYTRDWLFALIGYIAVMLAVAIFGGQSEYAVRALAFALFMIVLGLPFCIWRDLVRIRRERTASALAAQDLGRPAFRSRPIAPTLDQPPQRSPSSPGQPRADI